MYNRVLLGQAKEKGKGKAKRVLRPLTEILEGSCCFLKPWVVDPRMRNKVFVKLRCFHVGQILQEQNLTHREFHPSTTDRRFSYPPS